MNPKSVMRLVLVTAFIALSLTPAMAQASRVACEMMPVEALEASFAGPSAIVERTDEPGVSLCSWSAGEGLHVKLHSITAESQNIVGGTPLDYFKQQAAWRIDSIGAANITDITGPWQAGLLTDVTTEPNPQQFYSITFLSKDDTVTLETVGLPRQATVALAKAVAEAM